MPGRPSFRDIVFAAESAGVESYLHAVAGELEGRRDDEAWAEFGTILAQAHILSSLSGIASMYDALRIDTPEARRSAKARRFSKEMYGIVPWDESKHPRGQPENAGQFGPGGGGASPPPGPMSPMQAESIEHQKRALAAAEAKKERQAEAKEPRTLIRLREILND